MGKFEVDITKDGNCYPDKVIITINKEEVFKRELKTYVDKYKSNEDLGKVLRELIK
jgi:hypothetical protein